jgi:hypothetical protein
VGNATGSLVCRDSQRQNATASFQDTRTTGCRGKFSGQPKSHSLNIQLPLSWNRLSWLGSNRANCSFVISHSLIQKDWSIRTRVIGFSSLSPRASPMVNSPAGT